MFVAHGLWSVGGGLQLWFENEGRLVADAALLAPAPPDWSGPLQEALAPAELPDRPILLLPHDGELVPAEVPAHAVTTPDAADLLLEIAYLRAGSEGSWALSGELRFLAEVASGVARWVYSGRVVPTVRAENAAWVARWVLVDDGPIRAWRTQLQACLPPILRAQVVDGRASVAADVLADLVDELCDAIVRATLRLSEPRVAAATHPLVQALDTGEALEPGDRELAAGLRRWAGSSALDTPDVIFRLAEPPDDDDAAVGVPRWLLETCLRTEDTAPVALRALPSSSRTDALAMHALGRAMTAYPPLRRHTPNVHQHVLMLSTAEAIDFVAKGAPALRAVGITVLLPRAWTRLDPTLTLQVSAPAASAAVEAGAAGMDQVLDYQWRLALGEVSVSKAEMAALTKAAAPLVRLRGEWVQVDPTVLGRAALPRGPGRHLGDPRSAARCAHRRCATAGAGPRRTGVRLAGRGRSHTRWRTGGVAGCAAPVPAARFGLVGVHEPPRPGRGAR